MATARAPQEPSQSGVNELMVCTICMDRFQNAKMLPCQHNFCLECLKHWWKDKGAKDEVSCPVCRQSFVVPENGLDAIQNNLLLQSLMEVSNAGGPTSYHCILYC